MSRLATVTVSDDDEAEGITVESTGYSNEDLVIVLLRAAEAILQTDMAEMLKVEEDWDKLTAGQQRGYLVMNSRLLMFDTLSNTDPANLVGVRLDLDPV